MPGALIVSLVVLSVACHQEWKRSKVSWMTLPLEMSNSNAAPFKTASLSHCYLPVFDFYIVTGSFDCYIVTDNSGWYIVTDFIRKIVI